MFTLNTKKSAENPMGINYNRHEPNSDTRMINIKLISNFLHA